MLLQTQDLTRVFTMGGDKIVAVNRLNMTIATGDFIALMGPSGSGKSTLLYLLGGLDRPTSGKIMVDGDDITSLSERQLATYRNQTIGFIFQDFHLQEHLNVLENVELPLKFRGVLRAQRQQIGRELIARVGLLPRISHKPGELSGGERQRVAIARALSSSPRLILADEPTGNLDTKTGAEIVQLLADLNRSGITLIVVTHNPQVADKAHRRFAIQDGLLREQ